LNFWDVAGDDYYFEIRNEFYKDTNVGLLVFDATARDSFISLQKWLEEVLHYCKNPIKLILVGNKMDVEKEGKVTAEEAKTFAEQLGCRYVILAFLKSGSTSFSKD
jgi:DnaJ family protein C protein 27